MATYLKILHPDDRNGVENTFVRFGELPNQDFSYSGIDGGATRGISCFQAARNKSRYFLSIGAIGSAPNTLISLVSSYHQGERKIYELTGDLVGVGDDGEPLLKNAKILRQLQIINGEIADPIEYAKNPPRYIYEEIYVRP